MSYDSEKVAVAVRKHRKAAGLTQAELAERAGLAFETISRVESGREPPSLRTAVSLANALGASLDAIVARAPESGPRVVSRVTPDQRRLAAAAKKLEPKMLKHLVAIATGLAGRKGTRSTGKS